MPSLQVLTARLADGHESRKISYIASNDDVAKALRILFDEKVALVFQNTTELENNVVFDAIVCSPPLGRGSQRDGLVPGFGGEVVRQLAPLLAEGGTLYWVAGRDAVFSRLAKNTLADLQNDGLNAVATIDVASGGFSGTAVEGVVIALRRGVPASRFVGALRDLETAKPMAAALLNGPSRKAGPSWTWLDIDDQRTFVDLEHLRLLEKLKPRGRYENAILASLLLGSTTRKADRPIRDVDQGAAFLFVPEHAGGRVTADLDEQAAEPKAVYRLTVDPTKASPRFLARLLNGPYGRQLRADAASGVRIQRVSTKKLLALELPIPDMVTQDRIARIDGDIGLLQATFRDMQSALDQDWAGLSAVAENLDGLKAVLDIERQIADWWRELPYPILV
jgi:hypothetical protein